MNGSGNSSRIVIGLLIAAVGVLLLLQNTGLASFDAVVRWAPSLFILFGLWRLVANGFRRVFWPIVIIAIALIVQLSWLGVDGAIFWPVVLIGAGVAVILGRTPRRRPQPEPVGQSAASRFTEEGGEVGAFNIFNSNKENVASGDFRGGQTTTVMGSAQMDLRDSVVADRPATLEVTVVMGEARLRVPPHWSVRFDNTTVMGETKDERPHHESQDGAPDLIITGQVVMGSLKIDD